MPCSHDSQMIRMHKMIVLGLLPYILLVESSNNLTIQIHKFPSQTILQLISKLIELNKKSLGTSGIFYRW